MRRTIIPSLLCLLFVFTAHAEANERRGSHYDRSEQQHRRYEHRQERRHQAPKQHRREHPSHQNRKYKKHETYRTPTRGHYGNFVKITRNKHTRHHSNHDLATAVIGGVIIGAALDHSFNGHSNHYDHNHYDSGCTHRSHTHVNHYSRYEQDRWGDCYRVEYRNNRKILVSVPRRQCRSRY